MHKIFALFLVSLITFSVKAQNNSFFFGPDWKPGYYIDIQGIKHTGVVSWECGTKALFDRHFDEITFAKDSVKAKKMKINADSITTFVMGLDSFVISRAPELHFGPVLRVMLNICYLHPYGSHSFDDTYYYGSDQKDLTELTRKNFIEIMSQIMADKPVVVEQIKSKIFKLSSLEDLVVYYNTGIRPKHPFFTPTPQ